MIPSPAPPQEWSQSQRQQKKAVSNKIHIYNNIYNNSGPDLQGIQGFHELRKQLQHQLLLLQLPGGTGMSWCPPDVSPTLSFP